MTLIITIIFIVGFTIKLIHIGVFDRIDKRFLIPAAILIIVAATILLYWAYLAFSFIYAVIYYLFP